MSKTLMMAAGDLVKQSTGRMAEVSGIHKSAQDIAETYLTNYDPLDPSWHPTGSEFYKVQENVYAYSDIGIEVTIRQMADGALQRLIEAQQNDAYVDDEELIVEIRYINVWKVGPLSWAFYSRCITDSDEQVDTSFDVDLSQQLPPGVETAGLVAPGTGTPL